MSMMNPFAQQQANKIGGVKNPVKQVQEFREGQLAPLEQGLSGATVNPLGAENYMPAPEQRSDELSQLGRATLAPRDFGAVENLVTQGHENTMLQIQRKNQLQAIAKQRAEARQPSGTPVNYQGGQYTYQRGKVSGSYPQQQAGAGGLGGRYGLDRRASNNWSALERDFAAVFGSGIPVNEGYRSYEKQVYYWNLYQSGRGARAAVPGTSNHGSGRSLDLGGAFYSPGSPQHRWLQANAPRYGWYWEGANFGEPWHWTYGG